MAFKKIVMVVLGIFGIAYITLSLQNMINVPLIDYDEANRAEGARQMWRNGSYLVPITGSPFLRNENFKINSDSYSGKYIYNHLERPPVIFWLMGILTNLFGEYEALYRLPSFVFGLISVLFFGYIIISTPPGGTVLAAIVAAVSFITSVDWWMSSQQAMLDTGMATFLFLSLISVLNFLKYKNKFYLFLSGIFIGFSVLCKGQPAAVIIFPILYLFFKKKMVFKDLIIIALSTSIVILPWAVLVIYKFGFSDFFNIFILGFVKQRALIEDVTQNTPIYWYLRWWIDKFRTGFVFFTLLFIIDLYKKRISSEMGALLIFVLGSILFYSFSKNSVWWYLLPAIPAACFYIYISLSEMLKSKEVEIGNVSIVLAISSTPLFYEGRNITILGYGAFVLLLSYFIFKHKFVNLIYQKIFFLVALTVSLLSFLYMFPKPIPMHKDVRSMGNYYSEISGDKCLYVKGMPYESILFYSKANTLDYFNEKTLLGECRSFLVTPDFIESFRLVHKINGLYLYNLNN